MVWKRWTVICVQNSWCSLGMPECILAIGVFDGSCLLYPAVHASIDMTTFSTLGAITSHCYLVSGVFPDRIAFPCLAATLLGPSSDQLLQNYCLSAHEAAMVREGIQFSGLTQLAGRVDIDFGIVWLLWYSPTFHPEAAYCSGIQVHLPGETS